MNGRFATNFGAATVAAGVMGKEAGPGPQGPLEKLAQDKPPVLVCMEDLSREIEWAQSAQSRLEDRFGIILAPVPGDDGCNSAPQPAAMSPLVEMLCQLVDRVRYLRSRQERLLERSQV